MTAVPAAVRWARTLQAIAQSGLAWDPGSYDRERYQEIRRVAAEMLAALDGGDPERVEGLLANEAGHATPKLDVRGVVFRRGEILLVQERDGGVWSLPGGWADVGEGPSEAVAREVREESGYSARPTRLLGLYDRDRRGFPPHQWHIWKAFFLCELEAETQESLGSETVAARFFGRREVSALPLRFGAATLREIERCFDQRKHPEWPADFD